MAIKKIKKIKEAKKIKNIEQKENLAKEKEQKELAKKNNEKRDKEVKIILTIMIISFVLLFVFIWVVKNATVSFKYENFKFKKEAYGNIIFYHSQLNIARIDGKFIYDLYLRNDPRKLDKIDSNFSFKFKYAVVASFEPEVDRCPDAGLAGAAIGNLFSALGAKVYGASTDAEFANLTGRPLITCNNSDQMTVVELRKANETSIKQEGDCYIINVKNCEILEGSEKFVLDSFVQLYGSSKAG